jgi:zinc/manganese transport system permease protein
MLTALEFMLAPFVVCLLLIGINVYFGIHVIKREIIFIDIALAQIAAFGGAIALIVHEWIHPEEIHDHAHDDSSLFTYIFSIAFTTFAALLFTLLKSKKIKIPLEALIGIAYAVATTGAVIILDKGAGGDVHIHEMLAGAILWVTWDQILKLAVVILLVGGFHYIFRDKFLKLTDSYSSEEKTLKNLRLWDFLFYFTFGIVVVQSVSVGGILTVFAFLIIPASISALFAESWLARISIGLGLGTLVTVCGLYLSWTMDIPSSPTVILFLGVFLIIALILKSLGIGSKALEKNT